MNSKARLSALYSDFARLKSTNPDGYRANVSAWTAALTRASRAGIIPSSSLLSIRAGDELARDLQDRTLGRPAALDAVFVGIVSLSPPLVTCCGGSAGGISGADKTAG